MEYSPFIKRNEKSSQRAHQIIKFDGLYEKTGIQFAQFKTIYQLKELQDKGNHTAVLALQEEIKTFPWGEVWDEYLKRQNMVSDSEMLKEVRQYEKEVLAKRYK